MKTQALLEKIRLEVAKERNSLLFLNAAEAKQLLSKIDSLEKCLEDLLRSIYANRAEHPERSLAV